MQRDSRQITTLLKQPQPARKNAHAVMIPRCRTLLPACRRILSPSPVARRLQSTSTSTETKPYYITTPIFYVNAAPHIGHLYTSVLADVIKRWQELKGRKALLCTGTDEYGMKIQQAAGRAGMEPKAFCDNGAATFKKLAEDAEVGCDRFIRTTDPDHREAVEYFWRVLRERGYIELKNHTGWYSVSDEAFYPDSAVEKIIHPPTGQPITISKETGNTVERATEENYHFKLSEMAPHLLSFYAANPSFLLPRPRYDALVKEVSCGLQDLSISRPRERLSWGIPVPGDDSQTIYVWLDALVNYLTFTGYPSPPGASTAWPADLHIIGKDIIRFHCIYWPAFLLAVGLPLPKQVLSHAHWTMSRRKMSKSVGNVVDPFHAMQRWGVETMRFYLCLDGGIATDGDYSNQAVEERYDKFLRSQIGSLLTRVCSKKYSVSASLQAERDSITKPQLDGDMAALYTRLRGLLDGYRERVAEKMETFDLGGGIREVLNVVAETHRYIHAAALWEDGKADVRAHMLYPAAEALRISGILLQPVMPRKMGQLLDLLKVDGGRRSWRDAVVGGDYTYGEGTEGLKEQVFRPFPFTLAQMEQRAAMGRPVKEIIRRNH
ncbi:methionyl-tRNA synthetase [Orbilia brochopaga]|uniref:Probable methionine--tRNA ligase, mitochondrial n=1 Tax=Orbilia brochopaga TaxID=3140254 RepID=A0AAV9UES1_9PEZI